MAEITKKQHFIPRFYLKNFSDNGKTMYRYDKSTGNIASVSINSVCYQDYLYEFKDENDNLLLCNFNENMLSTYERRFSIALNSIKNKVENRSICNPYCFLTSKEKKSLSLFAAIQIYRSPDIIKEVEKGLDQIWGECLEKNSSRNAALMATLPFYKQISEMDNYEIMSLSKNLLNMSFFIGYTNNDVILTSDNPVIMSYCNNPKDIDEVIFPLTSNLVLYMQKNEKSQKNSKNRLCYMESSFVNYINNATMSRCRRWFFSKVPFGENFTIK